MFLTQLREAYYLSKFKAAIRKTNIGDAAKFLGKHKAASDKIEVNLKKTMDAARNEANMQRRMMESLISDINQ